MAERFLIISASMGAGHDGAARELARRLEEDGHSAEIVDFLACLPGVGRGIKRVFQFQLDKAPWSYEALYRVFFRLRSLHGPLSWLTTLLSSRHVRRHISRVGATAVVTTYPLASLVLGRERRCGRIRVPTATFVTDFGVHPLWVHPGVDANLCVHPQAAAAAAAATGKPSSAPGPLVPERFFSGLPGRDAARAKLGIPSGSAAILVVAGSWGVGDLQSTFTDLMEDGRYFPVVVCGSNEELRSNLASRATADRALVLGWTDQMPALMAACDVLLQNAGGLTCMEAFAAGLPVLTYRPIPGHGIENAVAMDQAGVAPYVRGPEELIPALERAVSFGGASSKRRGAAMFAGDAAREIITLATAVPTGTIPLSRRAVQAGRRVATSAVVAAVAYGSFTFGADAAVAHGIDVAKPAKGVPAIYVGVRLGASTAGQPGVNALLANSGVTAIVPGSLAVTDPGAIQSLRASGVNVANGGWGKTDDALDLMLPEANVARAARAISAATGSSPGYFVPASGVNGFDLSAARLIHERVVHPTAHVQAGDTTFSVSSGQVYLLDAGGTSSAQIGPTLHALEGAARRAGLRVESYSALR